MRDGTCARKFNVMPWNVMEWYLQADTITRITIEFNK